MGYAQRANPQKPDTAAQAQMRRVLALFPDRATYEQWLTAREVPDEHRAHMESFLPEHLQAKGTV